MKNIILITTALICSITAFGQLTQMWTSAYSGAGDNSDRFNKIVQDGTGNFIAVGYTIKPNNYRDFLTVKLDANGDTLWWRTKNGSGSENDEAISVCVDASGNIFVTGYSDDGDTQDDILVVKYDGNGNNLWDTSWNSPASLDDVPVDIMTDSDGNIYVGGNAEPDSVTGSSDFILLKYAQDGLLIWQQQFSRPGITNGKDELRAMTISSNNLIYLTGRSESNVDDDIVTLCYSGSGTQEWFQYYNSGNGNDRGNDVAVDNNGSVIVAGRNDNGQNHDYRIIKYTGLGIIEWIRTYNSPANNDDEALLVTCDQSNNVFVTGSTASGLVNKDITTIKYNSAGTMQWSKVFSGNAIQEDIPAAIICDATGNIFLTGKTDQDPGLSTNNDFITIKYNPNGNVEWEQQYAGSLTGGSDISSSICLDNNGNLWIAGGSENNGSLKDAIVIKYEPSGNQQFVKSYNGTGDHSETAKKIILDQFNNSFVGGYAFRYEQYRNASVVKIDAAGNIICSMLYNGTNSEDDEISSLAFDSGGNIIAAGFTKSIDSKSDFLLMKINSNDCDTIWIRKYDYVQQSDRAESVVCDAAGNIYVTGRSDANPLDTIDNADIVTIKYNSNGNMVWLQRFNGTGNLRDEPVKILLDNIGDVVVCGRSENVHDDDFVVIKYDDLTGNPVWPAPVLYNGPFTNDDRPLDMTIDSNGNIFVCGYSQTGSNPAPDDAAVIKVEPNGAHNLTYNYDGPASTGHDQGSFITTDASGNVYVAFETDVDSDPVNINFDVRIEKFNNNLLPLWTNPPQIGGPVNKDDLPSGIQTDQYGNVFVISNTINDTINGKSNKNWLLIQFDPDGNELSRTMHDGTNFTDDSPNDLVISGSSLWVTGYAENSGNNQKDMTVIRYGLPVGIEEQNNLSATGVFPNPFTSSAVFSFEGVASGNKLIEIFNVNGKQVFQTNTQNSSNYTFINNGLPAGLYMVKITGDNWTTAGKFVVE